MGSFFELKEYSLEVIRMSLAYSGLTYAFGGGTAALTVVGLCEPLLKSGRGETS